MTGSAPAGSSATGPGGFSVRRFAGSAHGSHREALELDHYAASPLDPSTLDLVDALARLELSALGFLRSVLVTPTHADARMTAFLVTWAYEKYWLADALEEILRAHPTYRRPAPGGGPAERLRRAWQALAERVEPIRESVVANLIGEDVVAVHAITATADEWLVQAAYRGLAERAGDTRLSSTLDRLMVVKQRHEEFFAGQAAARLAASPGAARLARRRLRRATLPIGAAQLPARALAGVLGDLVTPAGLAAVDRRLDQQPGLAGLRLAERAAARAVRRDPSRSASPPHTEEDPQP